MMVMTLVINMMMTLIISDNGGVGEVKERLMIRIVVVMI